MCPPSNFNGLLGAVIKSPRGLPFSRDTIALPGSPRLRPPLAGTEMSAVSSC